MGIEFNITRKSISVEEKTKMFLFGRWMSTCYSTTELNQSDGKWWSIQLKHFVDVVFPEYVRNGSYDEALQFHEKMENTDLDAPNFCDDCGVLLADNSRRCDNCREVELPF